MGKRMDDGRPALEVIGIEPHDEPEGDAMDETEADKMDAADALIAAVHDKDPAGVVAAMGALHACFAGEPSEAEDVEEEP